MKFAIKGLLLLFVAASVVYLVVSETRTAAPPTTAAGGQTKSAAPLLDKVTPANPTLSRTAQTAPVVVVYYFHGISRCTTCLTMERFAREAVEGTFAAELAAGRLAWRSVDYDEPESKHFVTDYGLVASAVVVVPTKPDGDKAWRNLGRIWDLVGDEESFKAYVVGQVREFLDGGA